MELWAMFSADIDDLVENRPDDPNDDAPVIVPARSYADELPGRYTLTDAPDVEEDPDSTLVLPDPLDGDERPDELGNVEDPDSDR